VGKISHKPLKTKHLINRSTFALVRSVLRLPSGADLGPESQPARRQTSARGYEYRVVSTEAASWRDLRVANCARAGLQAPCLSGTRNAGCLTCLFSGYDAWVVHRRKA